MTTQPSARTFSSDFKRFFIRGLVVLLPSILTLWIVVKAYQFVDNTIARPINGWVRAGLIQFCHVWPPFRAYFGPDQEVIAANVNAWWDARAWYLNIIGLIVAIVAVYVVGRLLGGFFGRRIYKKLEGVITTLPVFKQVYPYVRQVVDFLFSDERPLKFNRVVLVQYPRRGIWSVGFLTGNTMKTIARESGESVTVFIPSSPTPFTGYTITVPRHETIEIPITVEEALRFTVTGGVLVPDRELMKEAVEPLKQSAGEEPSPPSLPGRGRPPAPEQARPSAGTESRQDTG